MFNIHLHIEQCEIIYFNTVIEQYSEILCQIIKRKFLLDMHITLAKQDMEYKLYFSLAIINTFSFSILSLAFIVSFLYLKE